jgi:hypothetical protein
MGKGSRARTFLRDEGLGVFEGKTKHATEIRNNERRRSTETYSAGDQNMVLWKMPGQPGDTHFKIDRVGFGIFFEG